MREKRKRRGDKEMGVLGRKTESKEGKRRGRDSGREKKDGMRREEGD